MNSAYSHISLRLRRIKKRVSDDLCFLNDLQTIINITLGAQIDVGVLRTERSNPQIHGVGETKHLIKEQERGQILRGN